MAQRTRENRPPKKLKKEIEVYRFLISYLSTNPTEEAVKAQREDVKRMLGVLTKRYTDWINSSAAAKIPHRKALSMFNKEHDVPRLKNQRYTLDLLF